jgi:Aerotolerance regulator N-terminal/von Willebrand factor type A domain
MFFLNLSLGEFLALAGAISGVVTALYLLDRAKRKKVVSTLHFWTAATRAEEEQSRRRVRDPWSLLLQIFSLLCLLLAIAQLEWGSRERRGRDHVLLLDTSSWMASTAGGGLMPQARQRAAQYVNGLPARDRVLLVRAGGLITPVTTFTPDHRELLDRIRESQPSFTALSLSDAIGFARRAQSWSGGQPGEIVYVGPGRVSAGDDAVASVGNLRVLPLDTPPSNCGILRMGVRRSDESPDVWDASVSVKNYGDQTRNLRLDLAFAGLQFSPRPVTLAPGEEKSIAYAFSTHVAGTLLASIEPADNLPADNHASLALPKLGLLRMAVYTSRPEVLKPLLQANHRLVAEFLRPDQYLPKPDADVMLLDQFAPPRNPAIPSLWIKPPAGHSPVPVASSVQDLTVSRWNSQSPLGAGLHAKAMHLADAEVFEAFPDDVPVATTEKGPVVVARPSTNGTPRLAAVGFDPLAGDLRFELTTPLLFANLTRWLAPEAFRTSDYTASTVGPISLTLDPNEHAGQLTVIDDRGYHVPFTVRNQTLQLYVSRPSIVRIVSGERERIYSFTLPEIAEKQWKPPASVAEGLPGPTSLSPSAIDLWQWLALLGGFGLLAEWLWFGRRKKQLRPAMKSPQREGGGTRSGSVREVVTK